MSTCNFCGWYGGGHSDECAKMQQRIKELEADKEAQRTKFNAEWNTLQEQINIAYKDVARLEAERDALRKTFPHCDKHKPNGGHRAGCIICSGEKLCAALSRIDYACEEPNEEEMSGYDLHCDEDAVVANVQKLRAERDTLKAMCAELTEQLRYQSFKGRQ